MPKNKGKGGKGKRKGKRGKANGDLKRELRYKEYGEEYAQVRKVLGNCRVEVHCFDGKTRLAHVRGKFKKRVWINKDDFVLVGLRDFQDDKADIVHKYAMDETRLLVRWGEIPADQVNIDLDGENENDDGDGGNFNDEGDEDTDSESNDSDDEVEKTARSNYLCRAGTGGRAAAGTASLISTEAAVDAL